MVSVPPFSSLSSILNELCIGPIDSIMMLADQASQQSPIHKAGGGTSNQEEDAHFSISMGGFERRVIDIISPYVVSSTSNYSHAV